MHSQRIITHPKLTVTIKDGDEGPRHDPYHYSEYHVTTPKGVTVYHRGMMSWLKHNGHRIELDGWEDYKDQEDFVDKALMPTLCGYSLWDLHRIHRRRTSQCRHCGCRSMVRERGLPGETFYSCANCGEVATSFFSISAVI